MAAKRGTKAQRTHIKNLSAKKKALKAEDLGGVSGGKLRTPFSATHTIPQMTGDEVDGT